MSNLETYATFVTHKAHHNVFRHGHLAEDWSSMYPMLFDADDIRIAIDQRQLGYHYHEWLAAILIYHTTGFLSLIEAYAYRSHSSKRRILETLVTGKALDFIASHGMSSAIQCPDLLVYAPNGHEWFFCEVKGPRDKLREKQVNFFDELAQVTGKEIKVVHFQAAKLPNRA